MNLSEAVGSFLLAMEADGLTPASLKWYKSILLRLQQRVGDRQLTEINTQIMREYIVAMRQVSTRYKDAPQRPEQDGGLSGDTIASHVTALHRFFSWSALEWDIDNPMSRIRRPKRPPRQPKAIEAESFIRLYEATGDDIAGIRDRALLCMFADTGARLGGITSLQIEQLGVRRAYVIEKGNKARWIYWTHYCQLGLDQWLEAREADQGALWTNVFTGEALTTSGVYQILRRLKERAGVRGRCNPHSFRHNFARAYLESGGDLVTLARLLGHSDVNVTAAFYTIFSADELSYFQQKHSPLLAMLETYKNQHTIS